MKNWRAIAGVALIFLLGMIAGGLIAGKIIEKRVGAVLRGGPQAVSEMIVRRLSRQLGLDKSQREKVAAIVGDAGKQVRQVRRQIEPQLREVLGDAEAR